MSPERWAGPDEAWQIGCGSPLGVFTLRAVRSQGGCLRREGRREEHLSELESRLEQSRVELWR